MKLRTTLTIVMTGVGAIAVAVALALMLLTSSVYKSGRTLGAATERVRLLMELESYALQHVREPADRDLRAAIQTLDRLRETGGPESPADVASLDQMVRSLAEATTPVERESRFEAFVHGLRAAVARQDQESQRALADAASWNRLANRTGVIVVAVMLAGVAAVLAWLWRSALHPLVHLVEAIGRFAGGDAKVRAPQEGPGEIREVAVAFNDMAGSLQRQREQQLAFVGGVAHDLRSPLNALRVAVSLLDQPAADAGRVRDRIRRQVDRLERMTSDLLDRTRIEAGRFECHFEAHDLRDVVVRVVDVQRETDPTRNVFLDIPHAPVTVRCDALRIEQVIANLLTNAAKYSPETSDIEVALVSDRSSAVLSVTDHGIGVTAADRAKLFEPFRRGQNVGNIGGIGLGLSVARKIVQAHGGNIDVRSEAGLGSVFTVCLPLVCDAGSDHALASAAAAGRITRRSVTH